LGAIFVSPRSRGRGADFCRAEAANPAADETFTKGSSADSPALISPINPSKIQVLGPVPGRVPGTGAQEGYMALKPKPGGHDVGGGSAELVIDLSP